MIADTTHRYEANIRRFYLFRLLVELQLWLPIWVVYLQEERGLSLTAITALDGPFWIVIVLSEVPTGAVADRWGRNVSLSLGALTNAIAIFVFGIATSYALILVSYVVWGVSMTLYSGADAAFVYDSLKSAGREQDFERIWGRVRALMVVGAFFGLLLGAPLAAMTELWVPIIVSSGLLAIAWIVSLTLREPPRKADEHPVSYFAGIKEAGRIALGTPVLRYMMLLTAAVLAVGMSVGLLVQPFLASHDVDVGNFGWFLLPGTILGFGASLYAHRISAKLGLVRLVGILPLVMIGAASGLGAWDSLGAFAFYPLIPVARALLQISVTSYLNDRIPSSLRATILSIHQLLFSLMIAFAEPGLGFIADHWSLVTGYRVGAIVLAFAAAPLFMLWLRADRAAAEAQLPELAEAPASG